MTPVGVPDPAEVEAQPSEPSAADVEELAAVMTDADCSSSEYPFSDESRARAILTSDWLADHNRARDRELGERIATAIEADRYVGASRNTYGQGYYDGHADARAEAARIARAESERARQQRPECDHEPFVSDEGGPVFCRKCQAPMKPRARQHTGTGGE